MRPDEIERFFAARALGSDSLSMAIHVRDDGSARSGRARCRSSTRQRLGAHAA